MTVQSRRLSLVGAGFFLKKKPETKVVSLFLSQAPLKLRSFLTHPQRQDTRRFHRAFPPR